MDDVIELAAERAVVLWNEIRSASRSEFVWFWEFWFGYDQGRV